MFTLGVVGQFILTYIILGHALALLLLKLLRNHPIDKLSVIFVSLGLAPGIVSLILYFSFIVIPHAPSYAYICIVLAIFTLMVLVSWRSYPLLIQAYRSLFDKAHSLLAAWLRIGLALLIIVVVLFIFYKAVLFPIEGYDQLQHATIGRMIYQDRSLEQFPLMQPSEQGLTLNVAYPPGLHMLYTWTYLLQGSVASDIGVRFVSPMYVVFTLLLLWRWGKLLGRNSGLFAMLIMAMVPWYMHQAASNSIDAYRIFFVCASLYLAYQLTQSRSIPLIVITGFALALSVFSHTLGILAIPVAAAAYLVFSDGKLFTRVGTAAVFSSIACLGAVEFARRFIIAGSWQGPQLEIPYTIADIMAQKGLNTLGDILADGVFRIFTDIPGYGLLGWLFLASLFLLLSHEHRSNRLFRFLIFTGAGSALLIWVVPSPVVPGWANVRYILTAAPMFSLCGGLLLGVAVDFVGKAFQKLEKLKWTAKGAVHFLIVCAIVFAVSVSCFGYPLFQGLTLIHNKVIGYISPLSNPMYTYVKTNSVLGWRIALLSDEEKLLSTGGIYAHSVIWINRNTPEGSLILVGDDSSFCYYGKRYGIYWRDNRLKPFYEAGTAEEAYEVLVELGVDYIQFTPTIKTFAMFRDAWFEEIAGNPEMCTLVADSGDSYPCRAWIYRLEKPG